MSDANQKNDNKNSLVKMKLASAGDVDRRKFLLRVLQSSGQIVLASGIIYSVTLVTDKNGMRAGAK